MKKSGQAVVELAEGEGDVINLGKVESSMAAAVNGLKQEYNSSVTGRITPGASYLNPLSSQSS